MDGNPLIYYYSEYRKKVIDRILDVSQDLSIKNIRRDPHIRRKPRPCGLTIHTGIGCPYQCIYCYIYSMGFPSRLEKYPLSPLELTLAVAMNSNIVLGPYGTFLALGSVTEPFHPITKEYSLTLIRVLDKFLKNPIQVSTKDILVEEDVDLVKYIRRLSILYTVTTLRQYKIIEPYAPPPSRRFESMKLLRNYNIHVTLFLRPIIPGIIDEEIDQILETGLKSGVRNVVFGTMRINRVILEALNSHPHLHKNIIRYLPGRIDNKFRNLRTSQIKSKLINKAISLGYNVFPSACSASIDASKQACNICNFGPCGEINQLPKIDSDLVKDFLEYVGLKNINVEVDGWIVKIGLREKVKRVKKLLNYLSTVTRRRIIINLI